MYITAPQSHAQIEEGLQLMKTLSLVRPTAQVGSNYYFQPITHSFYYLIYFSLHLLLKLCAYEQRGLYSVCVSDSLSPYLEGGGDNGIQAPFNEGDLEGGGENDLQAPLNEEDLEGGGDNDIQASLSEEDLEGGGDNDIQVSLNEEDLEGGGDNDVQAPLNEEDLEGGGDNGIQAPVGEIYKVPPLIAVYHLHSL